jgi:outer membrane protein W
MSLAPTALGLPTGVPALGPEFGEADAVPPIVTLLYKAMPHGMVQPYLGLGGTVMFTYNAKATNPILNAVAPPTMSIDPAPGLVFQGGLDVRLYKHVFARLDVKFIAFMLANAKVEHIQVKTPGLPLFESVEVGTASTSAYVNPLIVSGELGYDF